MRDATPALPERIYRKLRALAIRPRFRQYMSGIGPAHPLHGIPARVVGDTSADPTEFFDHYDAFASWATRKIFARSGRLKTLDVGSIKMMNGILSNLHDVTSLVLADCQDRISQVTYVKHDVCDKLPFPHRTFDVFTSMVSLPLIGLARYGDKLDSDCLVDLVGELDRVMKLDADLLVSMCLGKNVLNFNNGWFFDMPTLERIFRGWRVVDHLVDRQSSPDSLAPDVQRFTKDTSVDDLRLGRYRVIYLHLQRDTALPGQAG